MIDSASSLADVHVVPDAVTVVSVPARHPYVRGVSAAPGVRVLEDPAVAGAPSGVWWPPAALDPAWIADHREAAQLLHIHFGTESFTPDHLRACIDAAHRVGWPVVFTVHDLEHPQLGMQSSYLRQLDVLIVEADAVVTLTDGAASVIHEQWGRNALVVPHPSLLAHDAPLPPLNISGETRIGVHLKDLRPNVDGPTTVTLLAASVARLRSDGVPAVAEVRLHHRVRDERARDEVRRLCAGDANVTLIEHERLSDAELIVALRRLSACVLPYRHGTHSGWLELCWDLGIPVVAPALGQYARQHPDGTVLSYDPTDADDLADAVRRAISGPLSTQPDSPGRQSLIAARRASRSVADAGAAAAHAALYRRLLGCAS